MEKKPVKSGMPDDVQPVMELGAWSLFASKSEHSIYIRTDDYHPDSLKLSRQALQDLLAVIEGEDRGAMSREEALEAVRQYLAHTTWVIRPVEGLPERPYTVDPSDCWCFSATDDSHVGSSRYICILKATREIVFDGRMGE